MLPTDRFKDCDRYISRDLLAYHPSTTKRGLIIIPLPLFVTVVNEHDAITRMHATIFRMQLL